MDCHHSTSNKGLPNIDHELGIFDFRLYHKLHFTAGTLYLVKYLPS